MAVIMSLGLLFYIFWVVQVWLRAWDSGLRGLELRFGGLRAKQMLLTKLIVYVFLLFRFRWLFAHICSVHAPNNLADINMAYHGMGGCNVLKPDP